MKRVLKNTLSRVIKFCPKTGRPVKALNRWIIPVFGVLSLIWILIRVLPKPSRAAYPCMKVAIPFASSLLIYLGSFMASILLFKKAFRRMSESRFALAGLLMILGVGFGVTTLVVKQKNLQASEFVSYDYEDPLGPNVPIGEAKGVMPGRVVWVHNPEATNENCIPWLYGDGYFLDKNADQEVVDEMLKKAMLEVTGLDTEEEAWESVFTYFNLTHDRGEAGYAEGEQIFIKINAVHAWNVDEDLSILNDDAYGNVDTSPQVILAVLRQLIHKAGVPEEAIFIRDPFTNIFKHLHDKLYAEFPGIHYISREDYDNRDQLMQTNTEEIKFSDKGTVLDVETDQFYDCTINADYVLSLPAMKGHRGGGVTFFAKNHFGTNVQSSAAHMHKGLSKANTPIRGDYRMYRVFVDLMSYEHLGGKTLIYIGDFLWGTSMEHDPPLKFRSAPFNNDYTSSILVSLDPVAIASVGLDILQEEFQVEDTDVYPPRQIYVRFPAVDDYLHQAASSDWWPEGITYDPEDDGTPVGSLGVHEHWNNPVDRQYSRNLKSDEGIELIYRKIEQDHTSIIEHFNQGIEMKTYLSAGNTLLNIEFNQDLYERVAVKVYNVSGQLIQQEILESVSANAPNQLSLDNCGTGFYVVSVSSGTVNLSKTIVLN